MPRYQMSSNKTTWRICYWSRITCRNNRLSFWKVIKWISFLQSEDWAGHKGWYWHENPFVHSDLSVEKITQLLCTRCFLFHICIQNLEQRIDFLLIPKIHFLKNEMPNYLPVKDGFRECTKWWIFRKS